MDRPDSHSWSSILLVFIFLVSLFVPFTIGMLEKDMDISAIEKRKLSDLPGPPKSIDDICSFPVSFDAYYSDHFGLRDWFAKQYKLLKYHIGDSPSADVTIGKNGWLFLGSIKKGYSNYSDPMGDVRNANLFTMKELEQLSAYFNSIQEWLQKRGIAYLFIIAPSKHTIYHEQLPEYITKANAISATDQLLNFLCEHTSVHAVDLRPPLMQAKKKYQLYYKTDTHWNHFGANIAQYEIMKKIEQMFPGRIRPPGLKELKNNTRKGGDLAAFIGVDIFEEQDPQPIFEHECVPARSDPNTNEHEPHTLICEGEHLSAVIFRDSFFSALQPYIARNFRRSTYLWEHLSYPTLHKYVEMEQPDIVIEEWVERTLPSYLPEFKIIPDEKLDMAALKKRFDKSRKTIFSKDSDKLRLNKWLRLVDDSDGGLKLISTGEDPIILFPVLPITPANEYILHIEMDSSISSTLQVFYSDGNQSGQPYSEKNSIRLNIQRGRNDLYICLDYPSLGKHLRLDPISNSGEVTIMSLELRQIPQS